MPFEIVAKCISPRPTHHPVRVQAMESLFVSYLYEMVNQHAHWITSEDGLLLLVHHIGQNKSELHYFGFTDYGRMLIEKNINVLCPQEAMHVSYT